MEGAGKKLNEVWPVLNQEWSFKEKKRLDNLDKKQLEMQSLFYFTHILFVEVFERSLPLRQDELSAQKLTVVSASFP